MMLRLQQVRMFQNIKLYHEDLEKRGECCVVAHVRHESHVSHQETLTFEKHPLKYPHFQDLNGRKNS